MSIPEQRFGAAPKKWKIRALDRDGNPFELEADDLLAICIQHEMDHLVGKLFIDYLAAETAAYSSESRETGSFALGRITSPDTRIIVSKTLRIIFGNP